MVVIWNHSHFYEYFTFAPLVSSPGMSTSRERPPGVSIPEFWKQCQEELWADSSLETFCSPTQESPKRQNVYSYIVYLPGEMQPQNPSSEWLRIMQIWVIVWAKVMTPLMLACQFGPQKSKMSHMSHIAKHVPLRSFTILPSSPPIWGREEGAKWQSFV